MTHRRLSLWLVMLTLVASFSVCAQSKKKEAPEPPPPPVKPGTLVLHRRAIDRDAQQSPAVAGHG